MFLAIIFVLLFIVFTTNYNCDNNILEANIAMYV